MHQNIKNLLGVAAIVGILLVGGASLRYANFYGSAIEPSSFRSFSVSAEGEVVAIPDIAMISFSVVTEGGEDLVALQEENTENVNDAISYLKSEDVEKKDIKTLNYSIQPRYQHYNCPRIFLEGGEIQPCPPSEIVGYTIRQSVSVKIRDIDNAGAILAGVAERGANTVSGPSFTIDDPDALQTEARKEAIKKAQAKAKEIASAGGFQVGRLLAISEGVNYPYRGYDMMAMEASMDGGMGGGAPAPKIEAGSQDVTVNVTLRYEIR